MRPHHKYRNNNASIAFLITAADGDGAKRCKWNAIESSVPCARLLRIPFSNGLLSAAGRGDAPCAPEPLVRRRTLVDGTGRAAATSGSAGVPGAPADTGGRNREGSGHKAERRRSIRRRRRKRSEPRSGEAATGRTAWDRHKDRDALVDYERKQLTECHSGASAKTT